MAARTEIPAFDTDTPAEKTLKMLEKMMHSEEVRGELGGSWVLKKLAWSGVASNLHAIAHSTRNMRRPMLESGFHPTLIFALPPPTHTFGQPV